DGTDVGGQQSPPFQEFQFRAATSANRCRAPAGLPGHSGLCVSVEPLRKERHGITSVCVGPGKAWTGDRSKRGESTQACFTTLCHHQGEQDRRWGIGLRLVYPVLPCAPDMRKAQFLQKAARPRGHEPWFSFRDLVRLLVTVIRGC